MESSPWVVGPEMQSFSGGGCHPGQELADRVSEQSVNGSVKQVMASGWNYNAPLLEMTSNSLVDELYNLWFSGTICCVQSVAP